MEDYLDENYVDELFGDDVDTTIDDNPQDDFVSENDGPSNFNETEEDEDYLTAFLKGRGIDRTKIQVTNEDGEIEEVDFDDLSKDEKIYLLDSLQDSPITDEELQELQYLRSNRLNLQDFAEYTRQLAIRDYLEQSQNYVYNTDQLTDEQLFLFDLEQRLGDLTDEEKQEELESAKSNEALFAKKIDTLRNYYKSLEDGEMNRLEQQELMEKEQQFNELAQSLVSVAQTTPMMDDIELEDNDKEDVLSFLLDRDANGKTGFIKALEDPRSIYRMAWYLLKGDEAHTARIDYFHQQLAKARSGGQPQSPKPKVVKKLTRKEADPYGLDDLF